MNLEAEKTRLLKLIEGYKQAETIAECTGIKEELETIRKNKAAACKRMNAQKKAGDLRSAELSGKAYDFCCKYEKQLENIIAGYEQLNSNKYFTKDGKHRFRDRTRPETRKG